MTDVITSAATGISISESVVDWANAVPFTAEHARMLSECHAACVQISEALSQLPEMLKNSPLAGMLGL